MFASATAVSVMPLVHRRCIRTRRSGLTPCVADGMTLLCLQWLAPAHAAATVDHIETNHHLALASI